MIKLAVCYPWSSPFIWTAYADSVLNLQHPPGYEIKFINGVGWSSPRRHNDCCEKALDWDADLICIIGSDQTYPEDMLIKLTKRMEEGCNVISALVPFRGYVDWQLMKPFQVMAWRFKCDGLREFRGMKTDGDMLYVIDPADGDLQRVHIIGSGVLMFQKDHLLGLERPWFFDHTDPKTQHRIADMDTRFVWRLQEDIGAEVWVDTTIKVKHLHVFEIDDTFSDRFKDWTNPETANRSICKFSGHDPYKDEKYWKQIEEKRRGNK